MAEHAPANEVAHTLVHVSVGPATKYTAAGVGVPEGLANSDKEADADGVLLLVPVPDAVGVRELVSDDVGEGEAPALMVLDGV